MARTNTLDVVLAMAAEGRVNHTTLCEKVDKGFTSLQKMSADHELKDVERFAQIDRRLGPIESTRTTMRWMIGSGFIAGLGMLADLWVNHYHH